MSTLYDEVLLDHIRNARNYHVLDDANRHGDAVSPVCGDTFTVYVRTTGDVIDEASFQCECCGISMASASIMTDWVRGRSVADALALKATFLAAAKARVGEPRPGCAAGPRGRAARRARDAGSRRLRDARLDGAGTRADRRCGDGLTRSRDAHFGGSGQGDVVTAHRLRFLRAAGRTPARSTLRARTP
jgi:SUF system NifU family Fe-S assembly protein